MVEPYPQAFTIGGIGTCVNKDSKEGAIVSRTRNLSMNKLEMVDDNVNRDNIKPPNPNTTRETVGFDTVRIGKTKGFDYNISSTPQNSGNERRRDAIQAWNQPDQEDGELAKLNPSQNGWLALLRVLPKGTGQGPNSQKNHGRLFGSIQNPNAPGGINTKEIAHA
ncbi:hypothetical protein F3Y22_tig00003096pilonHSYRG00047 [Hibiscus syriacus]|uniref:Uncharacterized protein n=1 Tax=Hibiscus syriacus TaxID=106335 RepID=A0A6A3CMD9_HIBSY|nr:hypothetical protein F3Y22_tig00003096pilonHSYRG00047 [Hibiscus syriacus]